MKTKATDINVEKRDGSKEPYDVSKIKKSIQMATDGQDVNPLELESKFDQFLKNGIRTRDIQLNVIQHAVQLATPSAPDWVNVAGRALAMDEWANFQLKGKSFKDIVKYNVKNGHYTQDLLQFYTEDELDELGQMIKLDRDLEYSYASLITAKKKYLGKYELNQHMHMVNAMRFGQFEPEDTRIRFVKEVYNALSLRKISLATPFLSNLRKGGNVASCFIIAVEDDIDSIFDNIKRVALISKNGGGLGIYLGNLRAKGADVNGYPNAAGTVVQWIKILNDTLVAVNQGGKRAGAGTIALPIWHNDILDFLDMQTEHGDPRLKAYDVFPQVCVPDLFMERDRDRGSWTTFCPFEVKNKLKIDVRGLYGQDFRDAYAKIEQAAEKGILTISRKFDNARELTKIIMRTQFETGLPYMSFTDTINEYNPNKNDDNGHIGIPCVNLCTESFSNVKPDELGHVCNLASVVLGNIKDFKELAKISALTAKILDFGISLTNAPDSITAAHNDRYRTIGIGLQGLHDHLAREFLNFRDLDYIREIAECVEYNAALQSVELSKKFGPFGAFDKSEWKNGNRVNKFKEHASGNYDWDFLQEQINQYGIRNSQLTSPAPTTSTSIYMDSSASVLPVYDAFFSEDNKNGKLVVVAKFLKENPLSYGKTFPKHTANEIIDVVAELQKFIDTGCSMELIFDQRKENFNAKDLYDAIHYAHLKGIKAIYYIRAIKKNASSETIGKAEENCLSCSG
jgi:ribonucleoside-diphosphate reductase alpha chain